MNYIVMDLEFNQPFDFKSNKKKKPNSDMPFEIIQIGCVKLDEKFNEISSFNTIIKPKLYKRIHPYVSKITGFRQSDLNKGCKFEDALSDFIEFIGTDDCIFCVWGDMDLKLLLKNIDFYKLDSKIMSKNFINVQKLASKKLSWGSGRLIGLKNAIELLEIDIDENRPFHDAYNDAYYTSLVLQKLSIREKDIKIFAFNRNQKNKTQLQTDFFEIYANIEKQLGRKITKKEKKIFKDVYLLGKNSNK